MPIAADQFPRPLLSLDDSQLAALMAASRPLQPADRSAFLQHVAANLPPDVGPGSLHRLLRETQQAFLKTKALDGTMRPSMSAPPVEPVKAVAATRTGPGRPRKKRDWIMKRKRRKAAPST